MSATSTLSTTETQEAFNILLMHTGDSRHVLAKWYHQVQVGASSAAPCARYATDPSCTGKQSLAHTLLVPCTQPTAVKQLCQLYALISF